MAARAVLPKRRRAVTGCLGTVTARGLFSGNRWSPGWRTGAHAEKSRLSLLVSAHGGVDEPAHRLFEIVIVVRRPDRGEELAHEQVDLPSNRRSAGGVRRVALADALVPVALVAGVVVGAVGGLSRRILCVSVTDAAGSGLVAVNTWKAARRVVGAVVGRSA